MTNKDLLRYFRHAISKEKLIRPKGFFFDKKYYNWMRKEGYERHHTVGKAWTDYFLVHLRPALHNMIRNVKTPFNADVFADYLLIAWCNLIKYYIEVKRPKFVSGAEYFKQDYFKVETWLNLIEKIKEVK